MGGNSTHAETNYFGKGNDTSFDRAFYYPVSSNVQENFHNYTVVWTSDKLEWLIDGQLVRTLPYAAANGGNTYPQTPMTVRLGIWAGGDPGNSKGTIEWAGGLTDYSKGPYTMYIQSAAISDASTGKSYEYGDHSGSWQSIKVVTSVFLSLLFRPR
jgi:beta-glucanase (GH16 family)